MKMNTTGKSPGAQAAPRPRTAFWRRMLAWGMLIGTALLSEFAAAAPPAWAHYRGDRILIKPRERIPLTQIAKLNAHLGTHVLRRFRRIGNWMVLELPPRVSVSNAIAFFQRSQLVKYAEPDYIMHLTDIPNDPHFWNGDQWSLINVGQYGGTPGADIDATNAWSIQNSASNVIVAVVDTGIRYTHEDLAANLWHNPQENADGYTNDLYGINLVNNGRGNGDPWDDYGHGTHIAGIIGAVGNNGVGIAGICWNVQLMALKFIDTNGNGTVADAIACLDFAASHGAQVVNASWGDFGFTSAALWDAVNMLRNQNILFIAAAGNSGNDNDVTQFYPASYAASLDNVIAVAATDRHDNLAPWSDYGPLSVQIAAPGDPIYSCWNGSDSDYQYDQGTSMAAPHVAGACALVWGEYPNLTALQVKDQVLNSVEVLTNLNGLVGTGGRLDLYNALAAAPQPKSPPPATTVWWNDALPAGAAAVTTDVTNYDSNGNVEWIDTPWNWVASYPPFDGRSVAAQMQLQSGIQRLSFNFATNTLPVYPGDTLFVYAYLDPTNPPDEIMVEWSDGCWEHRAFWGNDDIAWGEDGTSDRLDMGALPPTGQWVKLAVPASALELEGATLTGMSFLLYNGAAAVDDAGRQSTNAAPAQNLYVADSGSGDIYEFAADGTQTTFASGFGGTTAFGFDPAGNLLVGDGNYIYKVTPDGTQSTFGVAGTNGGALSLAVNQAGEVFEGNSDGNLYQFTPAGTRTVLAAGSIGYDRPWALTFDGAGNLFESDIPYSASSGTIYEYTPDGSGSKFAVNAVMAPFGLAFDGAGNLFVADARNEQVIKIAPDKSWSVVAAGFDLPYGVAVDAAGNVFTSDANRNVIYKTAPDGTQTVFASGLNRPTVMLFAPARPPY